MDKQAETKRRKLILKTLAEKKTVLTETMLKVLNNAGFPSKLESLRKDIYFLKHRGYDVSFRDHNKVIQSSISTSAYYPGVEDISCTLHQFAVLWHLCEEPASFDTLRKKVSDPNKKEAGINYFRPNIINPLISDGMIEYVPKKYHLRKFKFGIITIPGDSETLIGKIDSFLSENSFDLPADAYLQLCNYLKKHGTDTDEKKYVQPSELSHKKQVTERKKYNTANKTADAQFLFDCLYRMALWTPKKGIKNASDEVSDKVLGKLADDFNTSLSGLGCRLDFLQNSDERIAQKMLEDFRLALSDPEHRPGLPEVMINSTNYYEETSFFLILKHGDAQKVRKMLVRSGLL